MNFSKEAGEWSCAACGGQLSLERVCFTYMKGNFEMDMPACPACGLVIVPESLAYGKMAETERVLEDK